MMFCLVNILNNFKKDYLTQPDEDRDENQEDISRLSISPCNSLNSPSFSRTVFRRS